jgi:putative membrane protein
MREATVHSLALLPSFVAYFAVALTLLGLFVVVYLRITPYRELALIRAGNAAAATSLVGAMLGFVVALASAIAHSVSFVDMVVWAVVALVVQLVAFGIVRLLLPAVSRHVHDGQVAAGVFLGGTALAIGILNAACMTY